MSWQDRDYNREPNQSTYTRYQGGPPGGGGGFSRMGGPGGPGGALSGAPITKWLLIINCVVFLLDNILGGSSRGSAIAPSNWGDFSIDRAIDHFQIWRFFSYQFIHAGLGHLFFNMVGLFFFGPLVERWWGAKRYLAFYLLNGSCGALLFTLLASFPGVIAPKGMPVEIISLVGASGSLFGNLVACSLLYPTLRVMLIIPPIPMTMRTMANIFLGIAVFSIVFGASNAGGEAAHLGGAVLGFILIKKARWLNFVDRFSSISPAELQLKRLQKKAQRQQNNLARQQEEVNQILDKVKNQGLQSLSTKEQQILKAATDQQRDPRPPGR